MDTASIVNDVDLVHLRKQEKVFDQIVLQYGQPPEWQRPQGFETLCQIILEQQVSLASAKAHFKRLKEALPHFSPEGIQQLTDVEFRECHISRQKTRYLRALSEAILNQQLDLTSLPNKNEETIREELTAIKGIGQWTSDIYLLFCLQYKDIMPLGDIAVVNTLKELFGEIDRSEMEKFVERWKPRRSLATYLLWHHYLSKRKREA